MAAKAGYDAIEPWIRDIQDYVSKGGTLAELRKRISDHGLAVPSAIGFAKWIVDDDTERAKGLEEARRDMAMMAEIGGTRIAAPLQAPPINRDYPLMRLQNVTASCWNWDAKWESFRN